MAARRSSDSSPAPDSRTDRSGAVDETLSAILVAQGVAYQLSMALQMAGVRRASSYQAILVASAVDDASRLVVALAHSIGRVAAQIAPQLAVEVGLADPDMS